MLTRHGEQPDAASVAPEWKKPFCFFASRFAMLRDRFGTSWMIPGPRADGN